jgi:hypothetical protein
MFIGVLNLIFGADSTMPIQDIIRFPIVSLASVLPTLIFVQGKSKITLTRVETIIRSALHLILTAGAVFGLLIYFRWLDATNAAYIIAFFLVVYITAYAFQELRDRKLAKQLNERINAFHNAENETHCD